ncbi:MAG: class I tRNA ligase family protein, partial [Bacillota bacterium]
MELPKSYNPQDHEDKIYSLWEKSGAFTPKIDPDKQPFVISMPPPNITGKLHIGHALFVTLEDIMTRYHRMRGEPSLWLPGTDHAGIATQNVVEKQLKKEGKSRRDLGREKFVERI